MKRKAIALALCTMLTVTSTATGVFADTVYTDVSVNDSSEAAIAEVVATSGTKTSTAVELTQTDASKWTSGTDGDRVYIEGVNGAEVKANIPESGWLIFDWMMTEGSSNAWAEMFKFKNPEEIWDKEINAANVLKWKTETVKFAKAEDVSWVVNTSVSKGRLSNVRFTTAQTPVTCSVTGTGSVSSNGNESDKQLSVAADPGSTVTLTAKETGGDIFEAWKDSEGNVLSTKTTYSFSVLDESVSITAVFSSQFEEEGTAEDPYKIESSADLNKISTICASGNSLAGKYFALQNNVTVDSSFKGIAGTFAGIFDGQENKISGFNAETRGLFESLELGSEVKNLKVDANITASDDKTGVIAGMSDGKITDCDVTGTINTSKKQIGGIVGYLGKGSISNCTFDGVITSTYAGLYAGAATAGIAGGTGMNASVSACITSGKISGDEAYFSDVGGIMGIQSTWAHITNCISSMDITGYQNLGGIVGSTGIANVKGCYSTGKITGAKVVGGIVGNNATKVDISECYSLADVSASQGLAGGIIGSTATNGSVKKVVALNKSVSGTTVGRIAGKNETDIYNGTKTELDKNSAFATMSMTQAGKAYTPEEKGAATINGEDISGDTLKDTSAVAACFSSWDKDVWTIEAGKLPVLKAITEAQNSELPSYISGGGDTPVKPDPGEDPSSGVSAELKEALLAEGETNADITAVENIKVADGSKTVVHKGGNSTYPDDVYAGGQGMITRTSNGAPGDGQDTSEGSFTVSWTGSGYLMFDHFVLSSRGADKYMISIDGGQETEFAKEGFSLYSDWQTGVYHVEGTADQKHTAKITYRRGKWGDDDNQCVLFDKVRFVKDSDGLSGVNVTIPDGATDNGCSVTSDVSDMSSVIPGSKVTLTANVDTSKGWVFNGWKTSADSEDYISNDAAYEVTVYDENVGVYAEFEKPFDGNGTVESPYLINNYNDLKKISDRVNKGIEYKDRYFRQTADIDMSGENWVPIGITVKQPGKSEKTMGFAGTYDGDGKTISNMNCVSYIEAGLFGSGLPGSTFKNINIVNADIKATITSESYTNKSHVGFILGTGQSDVLNCTVKNSKATGIVNVGGIVGSMVYRGGKNSVSIRNCSVEKTTILATGVWDNAYAAGIAGTVTSTDISDCYFTEGTVTGYGRYVAGITGSTFSDIKGCYVKADVTSYASTTSNIDANAVGGICASATGGTISDCYVIGNVTGGRLNVGGILGKQVNDVKIINCYAVGNIKGGDSSVGGIVGSASKRTADAVDSACVKNSLYIGQTVTTDAESGVARIAGTNSAKQPAELANNYAFADVKLVAAGKNIEVTNKGADQINGADITKAQINAAPSAAVFADWSRDIWNIEAGKLPTLKNIEKSVQTGEIPAYAKESSSSGGGGGSSSGGNSGTTTPTKPGQDNQNPSNGGTTTPAKSFSDVAASSWYNNAVKYVAENGIMNGVSDTLFAPDQKVSRAMFVQILYNMEDKPAANGAVTFTDVKQSAWYRDAVAWAASNGIVTGVSSTEFAPEKSVTREQFAVMLYRYASYKGTLKAASGDLSGYADSAAVSSYAADAMKWAVGNGIITGKSGNKLDPKGGATRAEAAAMIVRYLA